MGKWTHALETGECYNCERIVGPDQIIADPALRWPVCLGCAQELSLKDEGDGE